MAQLLSVRHQKLLKPFNKYEKEKKEVVNRNEEGKCIFSDAQAKQLQKEDFRELSLYAL